MFYIRFTPVHPEGYPKIEYSCEDKNPHAPFYQKKSPDDACRCEYSTRGEAEWGVISYSLRNSYWTKGTRYELLAEVVEIPEHRTEQLPGALDDALNNEWHEGIEIADWAEKAAKRVGI